MKKKAVNKKPDEILIVTGFSGAGMSSVLKVLEDLGYEVFDNFPLPLMAPLLKVVKPRKGPIAIGIDTRTRGFSSAKILEIMKEARARLLFITCDESVLQQRFTETRRRHPLAKDRPVRAGIQQERTLLKHIQARADITIDTSDLNVHDLRHILEGHFGHQQSKHLTISLVSFGFRNGLPREADIVMDVRFLKNPHWIKNLKNQTGLDQSVQSYIQKDRSYEFFIDNFTDLLRNLLPRYVEEGKNYLTIAIGCTGGRHRSVYVVEALKEALAQQGRKAIVEHRDI